jgi:hypothetical protein
MKDGRFFETVLAAAWFSIATQQGARHNSCQWERERLRASRFVSSTLLLWWIQRNLRVALFFSHDKGLTLAHDSHRIRAFSRIAFP